MKKTLKLSIVALSLLIGPTIAHSATPPGDTAQIGSISASQAQIFAVADDVTMLTTNAIAYIVPAGQLAGSDVLGVVFGLSMFGMLILGGLGKNIGEFCIPILGCVSRNLGELRKASFFLFSWAEDKVMKPLCSMARQLETYWIGSYGLSPHMIGGTA